MTGLYDWWQDLDPDGPRLGHPLGVNHHTPDDPDAVVYKFPVPQPPEHQES